MGFKRKNGSWPNGRAPGPDAILPMMNGAANVDAAEIAKFEAAAPRWWDPDGEFRPLHDRVVVRRVESEEKTKGGIIIPDTAKEKPQEGEIIAVGSGARDEVTETERACPGGGLRYHRRPSRLRPWWRNW